MNQTAEEYLTSLRQILIKRFDDGELRTLCADSGVDYETLPGSGKANKARELVAYAERHNLIPTLVATGRKSRPDIDWDVLGDFPLLYPPLDTDTITTAINALSAAIDRIDKMTDQLDSFLTGNPEPSEYKQFRQKIEASGSEIVVKSNGQIVQKITADDFAKLPPTQLKHISVLEKSMENHYELWVAVYPQRNASTDSLVNAKVNQQLKQIVSDMSDDLNGILSFIESCGMYLDDHYMHIRHIVSQAKES